MKTLISALFFVLISTSFASDMRYYDVEIVIIENLSAKQKASENWPLQVNLSPAEKIVELGKPVLSRWLPKNVDLKSSYKVLNSNHYRLSPHVRRISRSKTQRVIFHTAWRQPGLDKNISLPVHFKRNIPSAPVVENETAPAAIRPQSVLEGILRVTLARYLHLEAELTLKDKVPEGGGTNNPFYALDNKSENERVQNQGVIYLKQKRRRMRSNELHYLDHPVLSILVNIMPYIKPEEAALTRKVQ